MLHGVRMHPRTLPFEFCNLSIGASGASGKHLKIGNIKVWKGSGCLIAPVKLYLQTQKLSVTHPFHPCSELAWEN